MNLTNYQNNDYGESDNQTVTPAETMQQPIVTLQYLLNENKMKDIALSKATHLIQLYKIQLQVKEQDYQKELQQIEKIERHNNEEIIYQLQQKIVKLQLKIKFYEQKIKQLQSKSVQYPQFLLMNANNSRVNRNSKNNSNRQLSNQRKGGICRYSNKKNVSLNQGNQMKRSLSTFFNSQSYKQVDIYRIEKTFLIDYLLKNEQNDQKITSLLESQIHSQILNIQEKVQFTKGNDKQIQIFLKVLKDPFVQMDKKNKQFKEVIKIQQLIIEEANRQLSEYESIMQIFNSSLNQIYCNQCTVNISEFNKSRFLTQDQPREKQYEFFSQFSDLIVQNQQIALKKIKGYRSFIKQKVVKMQNENKQLKRILDDMIKLIKSNKKYQIGNFGSIRSGKNVEQKEPSQKGKSISRK